jgi:hypothetical protein
MILSPNSEVVLAALKVILPWLSGMNNAYSTLDWGMSALSLDGAMILSPSGCTWTFHDMTEISYLRYAGVFYH